MNNAVKPDQTRGWALNNSRRPLLTLTFDLILIGGQGLVMDYPCGKFGDCIFSRFGLIVKNDITS